MSASRSRVSMRELLASCAAARAVSTPPLPPARPRAEPDRVDPDHVPSHPAGLPTAPGTAAEARPGPVTRTDGDDHRDAAA